MQVTRFAQNGLELLRYIKNYCILPWGSVFSSSMPELELPFEMVEAVEVGAKPNETPGFSTQLEVLEKAKSIDKDFWKDTSSMYLSAVQHYLTATELQLLGRAIQRAGLVDTLWALTDSTPMGQKRDPFRSDKPSGLKVVEKYNPKEPLGVTVDQCEKLYLYFLDEIHSYREGDLMSGLV